MNAFTKKAFTKSKTRGESAVSYLGHLGHLGHLPIGKGNGKAGIFSKRGILPWRVILAASLLLPLAYCGSETEGEELGSDAPPSGNDTEIPEITSVEAGTPTAEEIPVAVTVDRDSDIYVMAVDANQDCPDADTIKAAEASIMTEATAETAAEITITGLTAETSYRICVVASNASGDSAVAVETGANTLTAAPPAVPPPSFIGAPTVALSTTEATSVEATAMLDRAATLYAVALPQEDAAPTADQISMGRDSSGTAVASGHSGSVEAAAETDATIALTSLASETGYTIYLVAENAGGYSDIAAPSVTTGDAEGPLFTASPALAGIMPASVEVTATPDEAGMLYAVAVAAGSSPPNADQIKAGRDSSDATVDGGHSGSSVTAAGASATIPLANLVATTAYDIYVMAEDDESPPNLSGITQLPLEALPADPVIAPVEAAVAETAASGANVASATATGATDFTITELEPANAPFAIDAAGQITTTGALDFEADVDYTLTIQASNRRGSSAATATLAVTVTDVHDEDGDGLIEIYRLAQLNAIRYDLDGDGAADLTGDPPVVDPVASAAYSGEDLGNIGCPPESTPGVGDGGCRGYELMNSLDFDENSNGMADDTYNQGEGWTPIAANTNADPSMGFEGPRFKAIFEGNGYTISNLRIQPENSEFPYTVDTIGLFGGVGIGGILRNLGLVAVSIENHTIAGAGTSVGGLAGNNGGTIQDCYVSGNIEGSTDVGGLVGNNRDDGIGEDLEGYERHGIILRSYYSGGTVRAAGGGNVYLGGLVGENSGAIRDSYASGNLELAFPSTHTARGGLVGNNKNATGAVRPTGTIRSSYSSFQFINVADDEAIGGLIGKNSNDSAGEDAPAGFSYWLESSDAATAAGVGDMIAAVSLYALTSDQFSCLADSDFTSDDDNLITGFAAPEDCLTPTDTFTGWDLDIWSFGTNQQMPALKADFDGDGTATVEEFGGQR